MKSGASAASPTAKSFNFGSSRLLALAQQLRVYKPPLSSSFDEREELLAYKESTRKSITHVGFQESMAPVRFRPKKAAVLICLFEGDDGDLRVILTKRSSTLSTHSGEVSLPGGKAEEHDKDDGITATREAEEEIGLDPSLVDVVAFLEPFLSQHLLRVIPVVGILWDRKAFNPTPNPAEVEAVLDAPFEMFLKVPLVSFLQGRFIVTVFIYSETSLVEIYLTQDENRRSEEFDWMGEKHLVHFFDYKTGDSDYVIWGLTARILIRAATVVYQRPPAFIEQKPNLKYSKM
jgi:8-oxo-dGTP pyrophosphatase MutT (NUDIX family)